MLGITKHADLHFWPWDVRKLNRSTEPLVLLRIIIFQPDLQLNCFSKFAVLCLRITYNNTDSFPKRITLQLTAERSSIEYNIKCANENAKSLMRHQLMQLYMYNIEPKSARHMQTIIKFLKKLMNSTSIYYKFAHKIDWHDYQSKGNHILIKKKKRSSALF